jgi:hypothetical protein
MEKEIQAQRIAAALRKKQEDETQRKEEQENVNRKRAESEVRKRKEEEDQEIWQREVQERIQREEKDRKKKEEREIREESERKKLEEKKSVPVTWTAIEIVKREKLLKLLQQEVCHSPDINIYIKILGNPNDQRNYCGSY